MKFLAALPPGYEDAAWAVGPGNIIVLAHRDQPVVYLDEKTMQWRVLDRHISDVHPAPDDSDC